MKKKSHFEKIVIWALVGFFLTAAFLHIPYIRLFDELLTGQLYNLFANDLITSLFSLITNFTIGSIYFPAVVVILLYVKKKHTIVFFLFSYSILVALRLFVQAIINRPRPFILYADRPYLGGQLPYGSSFPSFHAMSAFFIAYIAAQLFRLSRLQTGGLLLLAFFVSFSRIYLGAHFILDTMAGGLIGILWGHVSMHFLPQFFDKKTSKH